MPKALLLDPGSRSEAFPDPSAQGPADAPAPRPGTEPEHNAALLETPADVAGTGPTDGQDSYDQATDETRSDARERSGRVKRIARRVLGGLAITGVLLVGGEGRAEASASDGISASVEAQSQESGFNWLNTGIPVGTAVVAALGVIASNRNQSKAIKNQTKEKTEDRFQSAETALGQLTNESTGEQREARLRTLRSFAKYPEYAPRVWESALGYLRSRRSAIEAFRRKHSLSGEPGLEGTDVLNEEGFEIDLAERRNTDRSALYLFVKTLPAARKQLRQGIGGRIKKRFGKPDELEMLDELLGVPTPEGVSLLNAKGINLDYIRQIGNANLSELDLTGAGMQGNDIKRVSFRDSVLQEARLAGSSLTNCNISGADFRAAYLFGLRELRTIDSYRTVAEVAIFDHCAIDANTKFGNLPDDHPNSKHGILERDPELQEDYRGDPRAIFKNLTSKDLDERQIIAKVREWQRNGLILEEGSDPKYSIDNTENDPNWVPPEGHPLAPSANGNPT